MRALFGCLVAARLFQPMLRGSPSAGAASFQLVSQIAGAPEIAPAVPLFEFADARSAGGEWTTGGVLLVGLLAGAAVGPASVALLGLLGMPASRVPARVSEPEMSRMCDITGKRGNNANRVSFSNKHWAYIQQPNLQVKRLYSEELGRNVKLKIATSTLRTIRKNGLDATAKKYGVDLSKFPTSGRN
jgi:large subunit ribosomal protein L28